MSLLKVEGVSFGFNRDNVFDNLSFSISKGEIFCLLGPNGCGKTTLLDCVLGALRPRKGHILLENEDIRDISPSRIARKVAYVPQSHEKTFPYKVIDIVLMGRAAYIGMFGSPSNEDVKCAEEALELVGILRLKDRPYTQLSGGEGQLVMIARALAQKTPLIIMDEPTAHLDFKHELTIMETVVELVHETHLSILMATHFPNHALYFENNRIKTRAALMSQGSFLEIGPPNEVLSEQNLKSVYHVNTRLVSCNIDSRELKQVIPISTN